MAREKKSPEPEEAAGAPKWMVTYSDCMMLLLTFFVLLISFSSFGGNGDKSNELRKLGAIFKNEFSIGKQQKDNIESFLRSNKITPSDDISKGSEKPTLEDGFAENLNESNNNNDFQNRKVFVIASDKIFWGNGSLISDHGKKILDDMAVFLKEVQGRIVISETSPQDQISDDAGLQRSWVILEYFSSAGLGKDMFSISASGTASASSVGADRKLEIVLLERSIYN